MFLTILLSLFSPFLLWFLYWYVSLRYYENIFKSIPGPKPLPLVGNALELADSKTFIQALTKNYNHYKCSFKMYIGAKPYLFFCDPKDAEFILTSTSITEKTDLYKFIHNWLRQGLLTGYGDRWRKHRKIITPAFHFQILEEFVDVFNEKGDILISKLKPESGKLSFDIYPYVTRCALDIICETAMGTSVNAQDDLESEYMKCVGTLLEILILRAFSPYLSNNFLYLFTKTCQRERYALKVVHGYTNSVINRKKADFLLKKESQVEKTDSFGKKSKRAFLDLLLEYSDKDQSFTEDDIRQEVDTFMFEGHDTTATSITFALYALGNNTEVQKKVYEELRDIFADDPKRSATHRDLQQMKYLEMVIKESLRLYTTIPVFGRIVDKDTYWNDILLPKGTNVNIFAYGIQNSSLTYDDPEKFIPERFTLGNSQDRNPFAYIPFSAGPRNCIGQKFAMLEMKSIISNVLRNFELLPSIPQHKTVLKSEAVLKSDNGVFVQIKNRSS